MSEELKAKDCPWCSAEAELWIENQEIYMRCVNGHKGPRANDADEALSQWNTRPRERELEGKLQESKLVLDEAFGRAADEEIREVYEVMIDAINAVLGEGGE